MNASARNDIPDIDEEAIRTYCDVLFGYLEGYVPIRYISEKGTPSHKPHTDFKAPADLVQHLISTALKAAEAKRAVFVVPATVSEPGSAKAGDIVATGVILVDIDDGDVRAKREHLIKHLGQPTLEVASGGLTEDGQEKLHLYWRLSEPAEGADLAMAVALREKLALCVGTDDSFDQVTQPIRVAGTVHGKHGVHSLVRLISVANVEYELQDLAERIDAMPALPGHTDNADGKTEKPHTRTAKDLMTAFIREGGRDGETRYQAISKIIGHWLRMVRQGRCTLEEAWTAVSEQNAATMQPPWPEDRLQREFRALLKVDIRNNGPLPNEETQATDRAAPELSEDALAQAFVRQSGKDWRHVAQWGAWLNWSDTHWKTDACGVAFQQVRLVCRHIATQTTKPNDQRRLASARTIQAVLKIAANDPVIAAVTDDFDQYPMILNTPGGLFDLETGTVTPHNRGYLITQIARTTSGSSCPRWRIFLNTITAGDIELQAYLARVAGYCLTGSTSEQVFFFFHGSGANGKSVFLQTIAWILGDYAATATSDAFTNRGPSRHLTELAGLRGARMVLVSETEADGHWAEGRIKAVTGGEKIRANFMYKDHFEFVPQFKLLVAGNHRPALGEVGEAMRRRLHLIPFSVTIPAEDRDPNLAEILKEEAAGILGWMIAGCFDLQANGLRPPASVTGAADEYFDAEDYIGQWIDACCQVGDQFRATAKALFSSWSEWAKDNGLDARTGRYLGEQLRSRGYRSGKLHGDRAWHGIRLRSPNRDRGAI